MRKRYNRWDHTTEERRVIRKYGGTPLHKYGYDGRINGRPVEVRSTRKDDRYRIQKDVHRYLVSHRGCYIFVRNGRTKKVSASKVSKLMHGKHWYKDRKYPHKFVTEKQIFR